MAEFKPKTKVRVTYYAEVDGEQDIPGLLRLNRDDGLVWHERLEYATVEPVPPSSWIPGTLLSANGMLWVVRKSNHKDSYRVMPVDLSGKNRTLPIEDFYEKYPNAKVQFHPSQVLTRKQREELLPEVVRNLLNAD